MRSQFALNVDGPIFATQAAAAYFSSDGGRVINVSSIIATRPVPGLSVYSATKAALDALTRSLGGGTRSRGITGGARSRPGVVEHRDAQRGHHSDGRGGGPERWSRARRSGGSGRRLDIAGVVVAFLASADAALDYAGRSSRASGGLDPLNRLEGSAS